jgi:hypothetical protein
MLELAPTSGSRFTYGQNSFTNIPITYMQLIDAMTFMLNPYIDSLLLLNLTKFNIEAQSLFLNPNMHEKMLG